MTPTCSETPYLVRWSSYPAVKTADVNGGLQLAGEIPRQGTEWREFEWRGDDDGYRRTSCPVVQGTGSQCELSWLLERWW
jgi:hypothetical protein